MRLGPGQEEVIIDGGKFFVSPSPGPNGAYENDTVVTLTVVSYGMVVWAGIAGKTDGTAVTRMTKETFIRVYIGN